MRKLIFGLLFTLAVQPAFAQKQKPSLEDIANYASELVANGDVSKVEKYDVAKYDEYPEQEKIMRDFFNWGGCVGGGVIPLANIDNNIKLIKHVNSDGYAAIDNTPDSPNVKMTNAVLAMNYAKKFKAILSVSWDEKERKGENADGVSCSIYLIRFFTTDGKKLSVFYSLTD